jgi:uncharacterized protein YutD
MKFQIYIKDPDGFSDGIKDVVDDQLRNTNLSNDEKEVLYETKHQKISDFLSEWVAYGENITLEFDTTKKTVKVLSRMQANI